MSLAAAIPSEDENDAMRERRCIVSGDVLSEDRLIRFAVSPDGEVTPDVADGPHSVILEQVTNGLAIRMAVLWLLCGPRSE